MERVRAVTMDSSVRPESRDDEYKESTIDAGAMSATNSLAPHGGVVGIGPAMRKVASSRYTDSARKKSARVDRFRAQNREEAFRVSQREQELEGKRNSLAEAISAPTCKACVWIARDLGLASRVVAHTELVNDISTYPQDDNWSMQAVRNDTAAWGRRSGRCAFGKKERYLSPEAMLALQKYRRNSSSQGLQKHGPGAHIWAMGVTLFELMSGGVLPFVYEKLPKDSLSEESTWDKLETCLISPSLVSVSPYCVDVHPDAEALLKGLLHVDAKRRPNGARRIE